MIFVGGYPRTGTTIMQRILCNDGKTSSVIPEPTNLEYLLTAYRQGKKAWDNEIYIFGSKENYIQFYKNLFDSFFNLLQERYKETLVIKNGLITGLFPDIEEIYPKEHKFIVMIRNPLSTFNSEKNSVNSYINNGAVEKFINFYRSLIDYFTNFNCSNTLFIKYEDLLTETESIMQRLRDFTKLSLNFNPKTDSLPVHEKYYKKTSRELDKYELLYTENINKPKTNLSIQEINNVNQYRSQINEIYNFIERRQ